MRLYHWNGGCKEYTIRTESTNEYTFDNDAEANDGFATATPLPFQRDTTGHLASQRSIANAASADYEDYYQVVLPAGNTKSLRLITYARSVPKGTTGGMYIYLYNKAGTHLGNRYVPTSNALKSDTLEFNCVQPDTFYIRVYNWSGDCKEYSFQTLPSTYGPVRSAFERTRFGSSSSFVNRSGNAASYLWTLESPSTKELNALFNMRGAAEGLYDVEIKLNGGQTFTYPGGFRIFADSPGVSITAQLTGPDRIRTGIWTNYTVTVKNTKHSMANGVRGRVPGK